MPTVDILPPPVEPANPCAGKPNGAKCMVPASNGILAKPGRCQVMSSLDYPPSVVKEECVEIEYPMPTVDVLPKPEVLPIPENMPPPDTCELCVENVSTRSADERRPHGIHGRCA